VATFTGCQLRFKTSVGLWSTLATIVHLPSVPQGWPTGLEPAHTWVTARRSAH
jgi:hypothetical protein